MDTPIPDDQLLTILRNIELNTAQQSSTPQNIDSINPLICRVTARPVLPDNSFSTTELFDGMRAETFLFPIPAETPYLIIPEITRSLVLYRDSEQVPFAFVNAGQTKSFRLPHLSQLRVDVLPAGDDATIILYAASRPYEIQNSQRASTFFSAIPAKTIAVGTFYYSPIIATVDDVGIAWIIDTGTVDAGITSIDVTPIYINDKEVIKGSSVPQAIGMIAAATVLPVPLTNYFNFIDKPPRYMMFQVTPQGAGNVANFRLDYFFTR